MSSDATRYAHSVEQEVKAYFKRNNISFVDNSSSFQLLDFTVRLDADRPFHIDVKEKRQSYSQNNWPKVMPETDMFILDDLAVRKCLAYSPYSGVLVRDKLLNRYIFLSVLDLAMMPKTRVNRHIKKNQPALKGKWIVSLRNGVNAGTLDEIFSSIRQYMNVLSDSLFRTLECYGNYVDEKIAGGGITRSPEHWDIDIKSTR
jgi:hypothetical protein